MEIYLDACCWNRPFDDQSQDRIRFETAAITIILNHAKYGNIKLIGSDVLQLEIDKIPDPYRKTKVLTIASFISEKIKLNEKMIDRAEYFQSCGFKGFDALHLAIAEGGKVSAFLTTDDGIIKHARRIQDEIKLTIMNPITWLQEYLTT